MKTREEMEKTLDEARIYGREREAILNQYTRNEEMEKAVAVEAVNQKVIDYKKEVTSLNDLKEYAKGKVLEFPAFSEGQPFVARVQRPSLLVLSASGRIPNTLMSQATDLFMNATAQNKGKQSNDMLKDMYEVCMILAESCLISPSLEDVKSAGLNLTDEQLMAIFAYSQKGVKALETFR